MDSQQFEIIQKKLSDITNIPLVEIKAKFPNPGTSQSTMRQFVREQLDSINLLRQQKILDDLPETINPQDIQELVEDKLEKLFLIQLQVDIFRPQIELDINNYNKQNPGSVETFVQNTTSADSFLNIVAPSIEKIFCYICREYYGIAGENQAKELFGQFISGRKEEIATVFKIHLKMFNTEKKLYELENTNNKFDFQLASLMFDFITRSLQQNNASPAIPVQKNPNLINKNV